MTRPANTDADSRAHAWRLRIRLAQEREAMAYRDADRHLDILATLSPQPADPWLGDYHRQLAAAKRAEAEAHHQYIEMASHALAQAEAETVATVTRLVSRSVVTGGDAA